MTEPKEREERERESELRQEGNQGKEEKKHPFVYHIKKRKRKALSHQFAIRDFFGVWILSRRVHG